MKFSKQMNNVKASAIREILKLTEQPDIISFAGGLPAPELFPVEEMLEVSKKVLEEQGRKALQYSPTEGYTPLRKYISETMSAKGIETITEDNILITSGSQQGLSFSGKIFLDENDIVLCESPSYLGAINAFKATGCQFIEIKTDQDGMVIEDLEKAIETNGNIKMIYVIPDFQNPSGKTWSEERRKELIEVANKYDLPVIEDNPYGELRYEGKHIKPIKAFDTENRVIYLGTFSKTFCPGLRIGWVAADHKILEKYILVKQGADLQTSSMAQREIHTFIRDYDMDGHIENLKQTYKKRRDLMMESIEEFFPKEATYNYPMGGLFTWVELPETIDTKEMMKQAVAKGVAYVPGESFFPNIKKKNTMRINYSNMTEDKIVEGIKILAEVIKENL